MLEWGIALVFAEVVWWIVTGYLLYEWRAMRKGLQSVPVEYK